MLHDPSQLFASVWSGWTATWPTQLLALIWIAWLISWVVASFWSGRTQKHVMTWDSQAYRIPILAGAILFTPWTAQGSAVVVVARMPIVLFWSNAITRKEGHRVIDTGPYGLVRHPIYTGLIAAILVTGVGVGTVTAILGAVLISLGMG